MDHFNHLRIYIGYSKNNVIDSKFFGIFNQLYLKKEGALRDKVIVIKIMVVPVLFTIYGKSV